MGQVIRTYHGTCTEVVERWGGHIAKYMGDGVLAYFGWPQAHEDDAERAVRAGLELADNVGKLDTPTGKALAARVGVPRPHSPRTSSEQGGCRARPGPPTDHSRGRAVPATSTGSLGRIQGRCRRRVDDVSGEHGSPNAWPYRGAGSARREAAMQEHDGASPGTPRPLDPAFVQRSVQEPRASAPEKFPWTLEMALSGGGLRASAFGLGALLYLAHAGLNTKVGNITSVSGGSITNGFVACRCDYGVVDSDTFRKIAAELARKIAFKGIWSSGYVWLYIAALLLLTVCAILLFSMPMREVVLRPWLWFAVIFLFVVLLYYRGWPITRWVATTFFSDQNKVPTLGDLSGWTLEHVFCATDLNYSLPFFFSTKGGGRLFSERHGRAPASAVPVHIAVRASAAFPPFVVQRQSA